MASIFVDILEKVQTDIRALSLPVGVGTLPDAQVYLYKVPWDRYLAKPCVLITPVKETITTSSNRQYDVGYGVQITLVHVANQALTITSEDIWEWRETIIAAFQDQRLEIPGDEDAYICRTEPGTPVDIQSFAGANCDVSGFILRFFVRRSRS